jgi:hypothetical protein
MLARFLKGVLRDRAQEGVGLFEGQLVLVQGFDAGGWIPSPRIRVPEPRWPQDATKDPVSAGQLVQGSPVVPSVLRCPNPLFSRGHAVLVGHCTYYNESSQTFFNQNRRALLLGRRVGSLGPFEDGVYGRLVLPQADGLATVDHLEVPKVRDGTFPARFEVPVGLRLGHSLEQGTGFQEGRVSVHVRAPGQARLMAVVRVSTDRL